MAKGLKRILPILDQVLVEKIEGEEKTKGGLFIPPTARNNEPVFQGYVRAVGPGRFLDNGARVEPSVKEGDRVVFGRYAPGREMEVDGKTYLFIREGELLSVLVEEKV